MKPPYVEGITECDWTTLRSGRRARNEGLHAGGLADIWKKRHGHPLVRLFIRSIDLVAVYTCSAPSDTGYERLETTEQRGLSVLHVPRVEVPEKRLILEPLEEDGECTARDFSQFVMRTLLPSAPFMRTTTQNVNDGNAVVVRPVIVPAKVGGGGGGCRPKWVG